MDMGVCWTRSGWGAAMSQMKKNGCRIAQGRGSADEAGCDGVARTTCQSLAMVSAESVSLNDVQRLAAVRQQRREQQQSISV